MASLSLPRWIIFHCTLLAGLHKDYTSLIKDCLHQDPTMRPTFQAVVSALKSMQWVFLATSAVEQDIEEYNTKAASQTTLKKIQNTFTKFVGASASTVLRKNGKSMKVCMLM